MDAEKLRKLKEKIAQADAVVIGAGAGLSASAGYTYAGKRFETYFSDFRDRYGIGDMYSGGFYNFPDAETTWAWWSRSIQLNRYAPIPNDTYERLYDLVKDKDYFVITTNVDHCFQRAGFDKKRLFYTQGDYGLFQCSKPCHDKTYDNEETVRRMVLAQGFAVAEDGSLTIPEGVSVRMQVPSELIPRCPVCGEPMKMNLRADETFVEDEGWHQAAERYTEFLRRHRNLKVLFLEAGVGMNTPSIIKYPFWQMTYQWQDASYACLNYGDAYTAREIEDKSVCIDGDIREILMELSAL